MDQPISHPNSLALWLLARHSREHATVLLSGEGADELFGGYGRFSDAHAAANGSCRLRVHDLVDTFIRASQFHSEARLSKLRPAANLRPALEKRRALFEEGHADHLSNCLKYDMRTHLVDVLVRQDKMAMTRSREPRPFIDQHVFEFAAPWPANMVARRRRGSNRWHTRSQGSGRRSYETASSTAANQRSSADGEYPQRPVRALMEDRLCRLAARGSSTQSRAQLGAPRVAGAINTEDLDPVGLERGRSNSRRRGRRSDRERRT